MDSSSFYVISDHVINYSACQTSELNKLSENYFKIYPNPVNDLLFLLTKQHRSITIKNIFRQDIMINEYPESGIDVSDFKPGIYSIESDNRSSLFIKD